MADVHTHILVPRHQKVSEAEKKTLLERYGLAGLREIPRILATDPAIVALSPKEGDLIKITRNSPTAGEALFYRRVVNQ